MRAYRGTLGGLGILALAAVVGCTGGPPNGSTGTGGAGGVPAMHRATAMACSGELAEAGAPISMPDGGPTGPSSTPYPIAQDGSFIGCNSDSDCPPCPNGQRDHCFGEPSLPSFQYCACDQCNSDQDCGATGACVCNATGWSNMPLGTRCVSANCRVDADCGPGGFCSPTPNIERLCYSPGYYCHTAADQCVNDTDCGSAEVCSYSSATGAWSCTAIACGGG